MGEAFFALVAAVAYEKFSRLLGTIW